MEEKTKAENMNLDNIITDIISAEEQEDSSARVLQVPAVALRGMTVLPGLVIHFDLSRAKSILAVEQAMMSDQRIFLVAQKDIENDEPNYEEVYHMGCLAQIKQVTKLPENVVRVLVEGIDRARLNGFLDKEERYLVSEIEVVKSPLHLNEGRYGRSMEGADIEEEAMIRNLRELFLEFCSFFPRIGKTMLKHFEGTFSLGVLMDELIESMPVTFDKKQEVLEAVELNTRYQVLAKILYEEIEVAKIRTELSEQVKARMEKNQKEYMLREQMNYIREELGEDNVMSDAEQFQQELNKLKAGKEVKEKIQKEINRFKSLGQGSAESSVERGYLETLLELPWDKTSRDNTDIKRAEKILERDHYGLEQVKERILEFLAVRSLTKQGDSPIICLVGPPGTGKTSIARSVAEALNKKYVRICLGGVRDEAEIRGHRRTYVGAMPGRIVTGLKQAGVKNPLMLLDEIDKVSSDYKGDTSSALLEVLDSEQNNHFRDHYVEIPVDLSEVLFIATANSTAEIPRPLLDRMETIEVTSYTANEKFHIAKEHLIGKQLKKNGLEDNRLTISDGALKEIIISYTSEAGVRELERQIARVCRVAAKEIVENGKQSVSVTQKNLDKFLGMERYSFDTMNNVKEIGLVNGLAWTSVGGETLQIEVVVVKGTGKIVITGQLGDVMQESAKAAISYIRSKISELGIAEDFYEKNDIHLHVPEGAVPKDGPSAGITMTTALISALTGKPVPQNLAMTGEITLRGRVLPIGGLREKLTAAHRAGIREIILPKENQKDLEEVPDMVLEALNIHPVSKMEEVTKIVFEELK